MLPFGVQWECNKSWISLLPNAHSDVKEEGNGSIHRTFKSMLKSKNVLEAQDAYSLIIWSEVSFSGNICFPQTYKFVLWTHLNCFPSSRQTNLFSPLLLSLLVCLVTQRLDKQGGRTLLHKIQAQLHYYLQVSCIWKLRIIPFLHPYITLCCPMNAAISTWYFVNAIT